MASSITPSDYQGAEAATKLPLRSLVQPAGFTATAAAQSVYTEAERAAMANVAQQVLKDPMLMQRLCDRIFELLREDLNLQQDRHSQLGRRFY